MFKKIKKYFDIINGRRLIKREIKQRNNNLKIIIGAARTFQDGWISTNYPILDLLDNRTFSYLFEKKNVKCFFAEHVWEHLSIKNGEVAMKNCYEYLDIGGVLRIAVPDAFHANHDYIEYVKPNGYGIGSDDHKIFYNYKILENLLLKSGFNVKRLEWFDEFGLFHFNDWNISDGLVRRSFRFDRRNVSSIPLYTSLIVDGIKC